MLIEIKDEKSQTIVEFTGKTAEVLLPQLLKIEGEKRIAHYKGNLKECNQIVVSKPSKLTINENFIIYFWVGYKVNYRA